jgi:mannitol/fructose-specific phosphotransferase system IIA component (Ntr-type)
LALWLVETDHTGKLHLYLIHMAAMSSAWSAGHHLSALSNLASKLERLERQAELLDDLQEEETGRVSFPALMLFNI